MIDATPTDRTTTATASPLGRWRPMENPGGYRFLVSTPAPAGAPAGPRFPLLLFLHGVGERGADLADVTRQGLPRSLAGGPQLGAAEAAIGREVAERFIVVAPQCPHYEVWDESRLLALLDRIAGEFPVDPARVTLTGLSMGGFGAWALGIRHPQRFAALVPICGGGRLADIARSAREQPAALRRLGVWAFHGAGDRVVPMEESERMIAALKNAGVADVTLTIFPEAAHDAWTPAYATPELYAWILRQVRP